MKNLSDQDLMMSALDAGFMLSTMHGQSATQQMPVSDSKTIIKLCRKIVAADRALNAGLPSSADYEEVLADHRRLVRELDVLLNGENAAQQASLCDIVSQLRAELSSPSPQQS